MSESADLHVHSSASDGNLRPAEVMEAAARAGLAAVALTDHDTVAGVEEAQGRARELGLAFAPGVEVTAYEGKTELHILGLFIDHTSRAMLDLFEDLARARHERSWKIAEKLRAVGVEITGEEINDCATGVPGRMHVAQVLVRKGYVPTIQDAFDRYISDYGPGYVPKRELSPGEAIGAIRGAGGIAALAHPGLTSRDELIPRLMRCGLEAIEVYYPKYSAPQTEFYRKLAAKHGLLETGGSDFHGDLKEDAKLGVPTVPIEVFERLRLRAASRHAGVR